MQFEALFSLMLLTLWVVLSFILSVIYVMTVIFSRNSVFSRVFTPKIQQGPNVSQIPYLELLMTMEKPGNFSTSIETVWYL